MNYLSYVNIKHGTESTQRFSSGNTLPLTSLPFSMASFAPQTRSTAPENWFYHPKDRALEGVRLTHQPSPWVGDWGALLLMPQSGQPLTDSTRWSGFRPEEAIMSPNYLKLTFLKSRACFELSPTERGASMRLSFDNTLETPYISIIKVSRDISFEIKNGKLYGKTNSSSCSVNSNYYMHFILELDCGVIEEKTLFDAAAAHVALGAHNTEARLAISLISEEQAELNLSRELSNSCFEDIVQKGQNIWENSLRKIEIETDNEAIMRTFYSCLYRLMLYPNKIHEYDASGNAIHYDTFSSDIKSGEMYTNNGFWDTFRTVYPLLSIIAPDICSEIVRSYIRIFENSGWMPKWPSLCETGIMPGTLIDAVIADSAVKGLLDENALKIAFTGLQKHADNPGQGVYGRKAILDYLELGYVPSDVNESVNCTQDYAYGDYCIAKIAELINETAQAKKYYKRSLNYKNIFDKQTGFMRAKNRKGNFIEPFDQFYWGGPYTEGSAWQNSFAVYHDYDGLAELHGGKEALISKLDTLFSTPPLYNVGGYGFEIHEMTEMASADFGQCAISNQPSFHIPWMYAALGIKEKSEFWVKKLALEAFTPEDNGFPGDEDNGTTAGWYIFACLGFYPICPGNSEYITTKPLVDSVKIGGVTLDYSLYDNQYIKHDVFVK